MKFITYITDFIGNNLCVQHPYYNIIDNILNFFFNYYNNKNILFVLCTLFIVSILKSKMPIRNSTTFLNYYLL